MLSMQRVRSLFNTPRLRGRRAYFVGLMVAVCALLAAVWYQPNASTQLSAQPGLTNLSDKAIDAICRVSQILDREAMSQNESPHTLFSLLDLDQEDDVFSKTDDERSRREAGVLIHTALLEKVPELQRQLADWQPAQVTAPKHLRALATKIAAAQLLNPETRRIYLSWIEYPSGRFSWGDWLPKNRKTHGRGFVQWKKHCRQWLEDPRNRDFLNESWGH